ncbi:syntaxin-17-like [Plakobranchus ocellatus]|uniref:Syntaxin-17-like n=1 Tax=Plakobranchus ocellatus TaxID=259542 RepID=A0AAV3ZZ37_9GAST|nr:syntaxin-17-like [Plakobranchus ocellatus]
MASFDPEENKRTSTNLAGIVKYPMKRLELSVRNFIKVIDIDLDRLYKHTDNIRKLMNVEDWTGLHREQVNASRTIQQINANIREIERARTQVIDKDLSLFDSRVQDVKVKALSAMDEFMILIGPGITADSRSPSNKQPSVETGHGSDSLDSRHSPSPKQLKKDSRTLCEEDTAQYEAQDNSSAAYGSEAVSLVTFAPAPVTTSLHIVPQHTDASNSWELLQEDIVELNHLVHHFAEQVDQQGEVINTIDDNIDTASVNVKEGTSSLAQASKYKSALLPVVGAVVGGMVGGPIGFIAGIKLGGLAGAVGGAAGFAGGRMLKKRQETISQTEMENLSDKQSIPLPEIISNLGVPNKGTEDRKSDSSTSDRSASKSEEEVFKGESDPLTAGENQNGMYSSITSSFKRMFSQTEKEET